MLLGLFLPWRISVRWFRHDATKRTAAGQAARRPASHLELGMQPDARDLCCRLAVTELLVHAGLLVLFVCVPHPPMGSQSALDARHAVHPAAAICFRSDEWERLMAPPGHRTMTPKRILASYLRKLIALGVCQPDDARAIGGRKQWQMKKDTPRFGRG